MVGPKNELKEATGKEFIKETGQEFGKNCEVNGNEEELEGTEKEPI